MLSVVVCSIVIISVPLLIRTPSIAIGSRPPTPTAKSTAQPTVLQQTAWPITVSPFVERRTMVVFIQQTAVAAKPFRTQLPKTQKPTRVLPTPRSGIFDITFSPEFMREVNIQNTWFGTLHGHRARLAAGSMRNDPQQGFVGITSGEIGEPGHYVAAFHTPIKAGSVRIAQANGVIFTLTTDNGIIFMFNAETETFLTRPPANYPTATPGQPLPTPTWKP